MFLEQVIGIIPKQPSVLTWIGLTTYLICVLEEWETVAFIPPSMAGYCHFLLYGLALLAYLYMS